MATRNIQKRARQDGSLRLCFIARAFETVHWSKQLNRLDMNRLLRRSAGLLACALMSLTAASVQAQDVTLGVIAGITGRGASYGAGIVQGAEMAVREINAAGGINGRKLILNIVDDASEPARSAIAMRRLLSASPDLIVGGWGSAQVLAHMDLAEQSAIPYIVVGATHPRITTETNRWIFRVIQNDTVMVDQLARLAVVDLGLKRIAVINDSNVYGKSLRNIFVAALARYGIDPVEVQTYQSSDTDFRDQLQRIKSAQVDAIAIFGTLPAAPLIMVQARAAGLAARFLGAGGLANDELMRTAPRASEGTILMSFFNEDADAQAKSWSQRYRDEFADKPFLSAMLAAWEYRAIKDIAVPCLARAGGNRVMTRDCIAKWRGKLFGIDGEVGFDKTGQLVQPALAVEVKSDVFTPFRPKQ